MNNYVDILLESLESKVLVLEKLGSKNQRQTAILKKRPFDAKEFDQITLEKGELIDELAKLDEGFDLVYGRVRESLSKEKETYKSEIIWMQKLISKITDLSVSIQAEEKRNKELVIKVFAKERESTKLAKKTSKVSLDYYKNMSRTNYVDPQFMDTHK